MESCGMSTIKYILFIFNFIFAISGLGIIIAGALVFSEVSDFKHFLESRIIAPPIVLIVAGAIVFIIAFLGCYGAIKEHYNLLIAFAVALLIIFIIELAVGIAAAVYKSSFDDSMRSALENSMKRYSDSNVDKEAWDTVQKKFNCCGTNGPSDWPQADSNKFSHDIPESCCRATSPPNSINSCTQYQAYATGCFTQLQMEVQKSANVLIGVGIGIAFVEVAGILLACFLAYAIKRENEGK